MHPGETASQIVKGANYIMSKATYSYKLDGGKHRYRDLKQASGDAVSQSRAYGRTVVIDVYKGAKLVNRIEVTAQDCAAEDLL
jgi:hypothetical protein